MSSAMATDEENGWLAAAAAYDDGKGISLEGIDPDDKDTMHELYAALKVSNIGEKSRLNKFIQKLRSEYNQQQPNWFKVSGAISRPDSHAGARSELYKLAAAYGGLYPRDDNLTADKRVAFSTAKVEDGEGDRTIVSFAVVFQDIQQVFQFINGITLYMKRNQDQLVLLNDEGSHTDVPAFTAVPRYQINESDMILQVHYEPNTGEAEGDPGSPLIDMIVDVRSSDITVDVSILSRRDPTFQFQRIENDSCFAMADPESAHIFPSAKCIGMYEWLDRPEYNRLALSRDAHLAFDGSGRGRGKRRKTQQKFAILPLRPPNGYATCTFAGEECYKILLQLVLNDQSIGDALLARLGKNAALCKGSGRSDGRWTIVGSDVRVYHPKGSRITLRTEETDYGTPSLVTCIPGVENLDQCWSNSPSNLYYVEAAEIMEKCLLWNYQNALDVWSPS